jgi:hypothetical protein
MPKEPQTKEQDMSVYYKCMFVVITVAVLNAFAPLAQAQSFDGKVNVTFSSPVEVPGKVLPAGTYVFEAVKEGTLTRIMSADERHIYVSVLTVPKEENEQTERSSLVNLEPASGGNPPRVDSWFVPGDSVGNEFIYPKAHSRKRLGIMLHGAEDVAKPPEVVAAGAAHVGTHVGLAVFRAAKFLVT